ncbi:MAG: hypothetical protein AAF732_07620 [Pseudomonadota bacterium]
MRLAMALLASGSLLVSAALAQDQQAGNEASTNADETFKKLVEKCDNTDALMLRARIRLQLGRTTDTARDAASKLMDQGLSQCGDGKIDEAKTTLAEALKVAEAGVTEKLDQSTSKVAQNTESQPATPPSQPTESPSQSTESSSQPAESPSQSTESSSQPAESPSQPAASSESAGTSEPATSSQPAEAAKSDEQPKTEDAAAEKKPWWKFW